MDTLNHLYFYKYKINLKPKELIHLPPYKGSAIRGVFGHALKQAVCTIRDSECNDCLLKLRCVYSVTMESPIPEDHPHHRKYKNAPHPYIIVPPLTQKQYFSPDDSISFDFVIIGKANDYLPYFIYAFIEMGKIGIGKERGRFDVASVEALSLDGSAVEVFNGIDGILKVKRILTFDIMTEFEVFGGIDEILKASDAIKRKNFAEFEKVFNGIGGIIRASDNRIDYNHFMSSPSPKTSPIIKKEALGSGIFAYQILRDSPSPKTSPIKGEGKSADGIFNRDEITISFETPIRIKEYDKLSSDIPFNLLIKRLSERAFLLAHFYCDAEMGDFEGFAKGSEDVETIKNQLRWVDWERYSNRQQTRMKFGGLVGDITYKGDIKIYIPLLRLGEHIHVGKAATFGLGKYRIISEK